MSVNKLGLSFFLLLAAVVSGGLAALPLRTIEAKERQSFRHASPAAADSGVANSAKVGGLAATVTSGHPRAIAQNSKWPNSSLLASLFLPQSSGSPFAISNAVAGRAVRVVGNTLTAGQQGTVSIEFDSQGDENAVGFSIDFDRSKLTYVKTTKGADALAAGATLNTNPNLATALPLGHLGYALAVDAGTTFTAGTLQLVVVTFNVAASGNGTTAITFGDSPISHEITDDGHTGRILILPADYTPGTVTINALAPTVTSLSPVSAITGGPAFTLTVNGTGFATSSVVRINGSNRPTTFINTTQLTALIDATDIQTAGSFPIDVLTPAPGGGVSSAINLGVGNPVPSISGLAPAIADAGGASFTLTVNGSNFISGSVVKVNGSDRTTTFISGSQLTGEITASDIQTAGTASVLVFNPTPGGGSSSPASLAITNPQPTLSNVAPATAVAGGASFTLTVNGSSFVNGSVVKFNGSDRATSFVSNSQLTAQITAADIHSIGTFSISVFNPAPGGGTSLAVDLAVNNPIPVLNSLSPASALVGGGAFTLTVNGSSFVNGALVKFNGLDRPTAFVSFTQLTAEITAADIQASGTSLITVFNPTPGGGASGAVDFNVNNPVPVLASIAPASKLAGDDAFTLTVTGTSFVTGAVVRLNSSDRATTFVDATHLTAQITAADLQSAGAITVTVFNPVPGGGTSGAVDLNVSNPTPVLASITPVSATVGGPAFTLTVNGSSFVNGSVVKFNGSDRTTTFVSGTQLTAALTAADISALGIAQITVFNPAPGGGASSSLSFTITTNPALRIVRVAGATFQAGQNNTLNVEIDAQGDENALGFSLNFDTAKMSFVSAVKGSDASDASFNLNALQTANGRVGVAIAKSAGEAFPAGTRQLVAVTFSVPLASSGPTAVSFGDVPIAREITDPGNTGHIVILGASYSSGTININHPAPTISSLSSTSAVAGDPALSLTVNGSNFVSGAVVKFNGNDRITNFVSSTQLTAQITVADVATAGTFSVVVVNPAPGGGASGSVSFTVNNPVPTLSSLSQTTATLDDPAFTLAITGSNFVNGSVVKINGTDHATNFIGATQLTTQIIAADLASAGTSAVLVFNPVPGGGTSNALDFTVNNPVPTLNSISPTSAIVGGTAFTLTVNGTNFVNGSVVKAHGSDRATTFVNSTQLTAQVLATDIDTVGTFSIRVQNPAPGGGSSLAKAFSVNNPVPEISNLAPASANLGGADFTLIVNGTNFVDGSVVKFNGSDRTTNFVNGTQLTAQITAADIQAAGLFDVTVVNPAPGGGASSAVNFAVNNPVPAITSLSPASALAGDPSFTLTVNGADFVNGSVVRWNGAVRATTFVDSSQLTAQIAANDIETAGTASVTVLNPTPGGGPSADASFTINNVPPTLTSIAPTSTIAGGPALALTVNGSHFLSGSVVRFKGNDRPTTFLSGTQLTAQITAADIQNADTASISVFNPAPGGGSSEAVDLTINNPVPSIATLSPASAIAGDPDFTLTVNGTNFVNGSVIKWNGANRTTTFVNATQLTTQISAADIQTVGTATVAVLNAAPGGGSSDPATFSVLKSNDVPSIATLSPLSAVAGGPAFTLTVNGSNFIAGSTVKFNGNDRGTSFVNDTQVTAQITATDIESAGTFHITVFNPAPGGGLSNSVDFTVEQPNPVPSLSTLTPASATTGEAAFTLTVNGSNFIDGSVVRWNGSARTTSFISSTQLTSQITAADIQAAGTYQVTVFNPEPVGGESNAVNFAVANPPDPAKLEFSAANYQMPEAQNSIEITVVRTGNMAAAVTVDFATDDSGAFIPCGAPTGGADQRCDYGTTGGTLSFAPGEASKSFTLLNTDDAYVEGNETLMLTLSNPAVLSDSSGVATSSDDAILGTPAQATLMILDNDTAPPTNNPIDDARYFVNQQYLDFLSRLPDQEGIDYWTDQIAQCGTDAACVHNRRIGVSGAFFVEPEFQQTGSVVYRLYRAAYGARPTYKQFMPDRSQLIGGLQLPANTLNFAKLFVARPAFKAAYPDSLTPAEFVDQLFTTAGLMNNSPERQQQINALANALATLSETRAQVLLDVIEIQEFKEREYNPSFVSMEYFGYLRRDPDEEGYLFWLNVLNNREPNNYRGMICSFITSIEYQERFSSVVTRSNADCGR